MDSVTLDFGQTKEIWIRHGDTWELVTSPDPEDRGSKLDEDGFRWYFEQFKKEIIDNPILKLLRSYIIQ